MRNMFIDEVLTQREKLKSCISFYKSEGEKYLRAILEVYKKRNLDKIVLTGMGSSFYACFSIKSYLINNSFNVAVYDAYDLLANNLAAIDKKTLLVCISQSGKSWEIKEIIEELNGVCPIVGVFNLEDTNLSQMCDLKLPIKAEKEICISNKSYMNTLATLGLLADYMITGGKIDFSLFEEVSKWNDNYFDKYIKNGKELFEFIGDTNTLDFVGESASLSTTFQSALVYREGPKLFTAGWQCGDYAHGWNKIAKEGYVSFFFINNVSEHRPALRMIDMILSNKGKIILVTNEDVEPKEGIYIIKLPDLPEHLLPINQIVPSNILMGYLLGEGWSR